MWDTLDGDKASSKVCKELRQFVAVRARRRDLYILLRASLQFVYNFVYNCIKYPYTDDNDTVSSTPDDVSYIMYVFARWTDMNGAII